MRVARRGSARRATQAKRALAELRAAARKYAAAERALTGHAARSSDTELGRLTAVVLHAGTRLQAAAVWFAEVE